jgi:GAF domain-containing protein
LVIPLKIRGQVIANLKFWPDSEKWSDDNRTLLEAIADRVGQALESARLFEEAQARASREQQINLITTQIRKSAKVESILQSTVRELGRALGASRTFIQLGATPESEEKLL